MFKNRTLLLIIALIIILLVVIVVQSVSERKTQPTPQPTLTSTPTPKASTIDPSKIPFEVTGNTLKGRELISIVTPFAAFFSKPVDQKNFFYQLIPDTGMVYEFDRSGSAVTILPKPKHSWDFGTSYKFIIKAETKSFDGVSLNKDVIINFKTPEYGGI